MQKWDRLQSVRLQFMLQTDQGPSHSWLLDSGRDRILSSKWPLTIFRRGLYSARSQPRSFDKSRRHTSADLIRSAFNIRSVQEDPHGYKRQYIEQVRHRTGSGSDLASFQNPLAQQERHPKALAQ